MTILSVFSKMKNNVPGNYGFIRNILCKDENSFTRNRIYNFHNSHNWAIDNPHSIQQSNFHRQFTVSLWVGIECKKGNMSFDDGAPNLSGDVKKQYNEFVYQVMIFYLWDIMRMSLDN